MLHLLIQLGAIVNFAYTIYWDLYILKLPGKPTFGGQWKFLTFWNLWLQLIYFTISLLSNVLGSQKASKLQKIRDYLFATLAFPIGQFVGIVFWLLFHVDRELVFPLHYDKFFPNYINHAMHTTVIPAQLLELYLLYHAYPKRIQGMTTTMIFCFIYLTWTLVVAHFGGVWVRFYLPRFFTTHIGAKIRNLSKNCKNSHCQSLIYHKIHNFKVAFFTKFTFFKHQILGNFWIKE